LQITNFDVVYVYKLTKKTDISETVNEVCKECPILRYSVFCICSSFSCYFHRCLLCDHYY